MKSLTPFFLTILILHGFSAFYEAQAADESLAMYFPFDKGSGGVAKDHSEFQNDGKLEGAEWTADGKFNKALYFDGKSYVAVMPGVEVSIGQETTWALWFKTDVEGQGAAFGGSIPAILLNTPGTGQNTATCFDGYPMTQQGKAGIALGAAATASASLHPPPRRFRVDDAMLGECHTVNSQTSDADELPR